MFFLNLAVVFVITLILTMTIGKTVCRINTYHEYNSIFLGWIIKEQDKEISLKSLLKVFQLLTFTKIYFYNIL